jgi:hypothetical protein
MKERSLSRGCRRLLWHVNVPPMVDVRQSGGSPSGVVSTDGRANEALVTENGERAVKVGRRPPGGEALTARSVVRHIM